MSRLTVFFDRPTDIERYAYVDTNATLDKMVQWEYLEYVVTQFAATMNPTASKEEYLLWVAEWKYHYGEVSKVLNVVKKMRDNSATYKTYADWFTYRVIHQQDAEKLRDFANAMVRLRLLYKASAARQMELDRV